MFSRYINKFIFSGMLMFIHFFFGRDLLANPEKQFAKAGIGFEIGSWRPSGLTKTTITFPFGVQGATPFFRVDLNSPQMGDWNFRLSCGYWAQTEITNKEGTGSVTQILLMFDLKQRIVPEFRFTPFVTYGLSVFAGNENPKPRHYIPFKTTNEIGYGVNAGAGFDYLFANRWVATLEFSYHYVRFNKPIGLTDDYSGPKITFGFLFLL